MSDRTGTIYTDTVIYSSTEAFAADVPYQTAIVALDSGGRVTGRIISDHGERVRIDDRVSRVEVRDGVPFFRKIP